MIDYTDKQVVFDVLKIADNQELWTHSLHITKLAIASQKHADHNKALKEDLNGLSDEQLRHRLRALLVDRLDDRTLSAAEIAQLKDVFNLTSQKDAFSIGVHAFNCPDCPLDRAGSNPASDS